MKMKTLIMLLATALAVVSLSAPSDARHDTGDDKTPTSKKYKRRKGPTTRKKYRLRGMHALMAKVCKMSEQQQERVAELNTLRHKAAKQFNADNAEKIKTLRAQIAEARKNKDKQATKDAYAKIRALRLTHKKTDEQWKAKIMAVLTPEQKTKWDRYQTTLLIMKRFKRAKLTDDQKAKVKTACAKFIKGVNLSDKKARYEAIKKLDKHIRKEILTDVQRAATTRPARKTTTKPTKVRKNKSIKNK